MNLSSMRGTLVLSVLLSAATNLPTQTSVVSSAAFTSAIVCYDQARARLMFALPSRDIWEWDGVHWGKAGATLPGVPSHAIYDETNERVLLVCAGALYSYDGHGFVAHGPMPSNSTFFMSFDSHRSRLVAMQVGFGGAFSFEWDGTSWQTIAMPGTLLIPLAVGYDAARQRTVAQTTALGSSTFQTWEWDGTTWALRFTGTELHFPLVFDPVRQQLLSTTYATWAWNGSTWTQLPATATPTNQRHGVDPARGLVWGYSGGSTIRAWNGLDWSATLTVPHPDLASPGFTFDTVRGRAVLFGGNPTILHREWDGNGWHDMATAAGPGPRLRQSQVFDPARAETIVFGGYAPGGNLGDTWAWNGTSWRAATNGPSPRQQAAITFDTLRGRAVLVGGFAAPNVLPDHWEWDGVAWTLVAALTPMGASQGALGFDAARNRLVFADDFGRTWEHAGATWNQVASATPLPFSDSRSLVWDKTRRHLQGNLRDAASIARHYEWNGTQWMPRSSYSGSLAFDVARGAMLSYRSEALRTDTPQPASATDFGSPCGGVATATSLTTFAVPCPGNAAFHFDVRAEAVGSLAVIGFGLGQGSIPLGNGCTLLLQNPLGALLSFTNAEGFCHQPFALPNDLDLLGVAFFAQAAVLDSASPGGIAMSQGLAVTIGD